MNEDRPRILVVDDEEAIRRFLHVTLSSQGYEIVEAASGQEAISCVNSQQLELIILDLALPDMDGVEVTRRLRRWTAIPIIILSVRGSENDKIAALDAGAEDYLTKPFSAGELLARIRVACRHQFKLSSEPVFSNGELTIDLANRKVSVSGHEVQLTPTEFDILRILINHAGRVLTHRQLLAEVWGKQYLDEFHMLHVNISNLRRKIEPEASRPRYIITESGVGYRLRTE
jgi:two-component system, OmpR family, KDP operon response regulator KdpE